jgi:hypothetical protein
MSNYDKIQANHLKTSLLAGKKESPEKSGLL